MCKSVLQYLALCLNGIIAGDTYLSNSRLFSRLVTVFKPLLLIRRSEQVKFFQKIKQFAQWDSLSVITPLVCSHINNCAFLITIGDMNNLLGSMHGCTSKQGTSPWPLSIAGSTFHPYSVAFRQYKYILVEVRLISCSLSTYITIFIVISPIIFKKNDENVILFKILAYTVVFILLILCRL